ncbi:MAG: cyclopropane-fatty-acyl-phospholipid synthase family protein [Acidobacteriota bacterium]
MASLLAPVLGLLEADRLPDSAIRFGIRRLLAARLRREHRRAGSAAAEAFAAELESGPIALETQDANRQHYEVPTEFFRAVLGPHLKYSSALWPDGVADLGGAEQAMLEETFERADLRDGQRILELGCGWGSLTLYMAQRLPGARILAISNSASQQDYIRQRAEELGLRNLELRRADMNHFDPGADGPPFDRVVSVEMFEHMRNYRELFRRISSWVTPSGRLFVHVFCHRELAYPFEDHDDSDWMARHFFSGGLMPSADLLMRFDDRWSLDERWLINGRHYQKTSEAWLANLDGQRDRVRPILEQVYGRDQALRWWVRWRVFFLACAELFGYRQGREWMVAHYRFAPRAA